MRILLAIVLLSSVIPSYGQKKYFLDCDWTVEEPKEGVYHFPEVQPQFPGGEDSLNQFIEDHLFIPKDDEGNAIEGVVYVHMIITKYGELRSPYVVKSTHSKLDRYALALVKHMPEWKPAESAGKQLCTDFTLPIKFVPDKL